MWTRKIPESPKTKPSMWYWYWDDKEKEPWIVELWPGRSMANYHGWWWTEPMLKPTERLPEK